jgi:superfamily II DNA or RNA helicase
MINFNNWEGWYFHHLARRAKTFGLNDVAFPLEKAGWELVKSGQISSEIASNLEKALTRLASIKNFEKTCDRPNCGICKLVVKEFFSGKLIDLPWKLSIELYRWQKEAKRAWWENGGRGIVKVVTGAGKTIFALSLISELFNSEAYRDGGLRTIIVVPTTILLDQWLIEIMDKLHIPREKIGVFYGKEKENIKGKFLVIYVINSAREYLKKHYERFYKGNDIFLIA